MNLKLSELFLIIRILLCEPQQFSFTDFNSCKQNSKVTLKAAISNVTIDFLTFFSYCPGICCEVNKMASIHNMIKSYFLFIKKADFAYHSYAKSQYMSCVLYIYVILSLASFGSSYLRSKPLLTQIVYEIYYIMYYAFYRSWIINII